MRIRKGIRISNDTVIKDYKEIAEHPDIEFVIIDNGDRMEHHIQKCLELGIDIEGINYVIPAEIKAMNTESKANFLWLRLSKMKFIPKNIFWTDFSRVISPGVNERRLNNFSEVFSSYYDDIWSDRDPYVVYLTFPPKASDNLANWHRTWVDDGSYEDKLLENPDYPYTYRTYTHLFKLDSADRLIDKVCCYIKEEENAGDSTEGPDSGEELARKK